MSMPPAEPSPTAGAGSNAGVYFRVPPGRFAILSFLTFGLYEFYWFYENWRYVRDRDGSDIVPWGRALFSPLWYPALLRDLRRNRRAGSVMAAGIAVPAAAYFLLHATWRLPDPFGIFLFFTFVPLLPAVFLIDRINRESGREYLQGSGWRIRHWLLALVMGPVLAVVMASVVGLVPSTQVTPGWMVWGPAREFLERAQIVRPGERIHYFYSGGFVSFADDGNILTDGRLVSYWANEEADGIYVESASFAEVADTDIQQGDWLDPTVVTVTRHDGSEFILLLSTESGRDRLFVTRMNELLKR